MKTNNKKEGTFSKIKNEVMQVFSKEEGTELREVFVRELKDLYYAEKTLVDELPNIAKMATSAELAAAISNHHTETKTHVHRIEQIFDMMALKPEEKKCEAICGLVDEAQESIAQTKEDSNVRDVVIIAANQKVEHYEIATYGTLRTLANVLNMPAAVKLLDETLAEEKNADLELSTLSESYINEEANME